ncbi:competence protein ComEA [Chromohalobacter marismortui]|uniref:Competence protein ComEA n=1 Tax=Chromohalobacter marismortui TaxID=42055 RepID=A0A4R7NRD0_9GAMM|nr:MULTISPECIES: ComEA family DNA-binding protein [Chromohalobacter]MCI0508490.1 helix-hairpin-helix domain-containing protein [Chromohalobacter sp.]MCI0592219.1 helix-hairpin-helix domain-containing protein [Chromohalobacter sp.]TDU22970.1 competence protein ComEA [Chromohalobacter marismortui]
MKKLLSYALLAIALSVTTAAVAQEDVTTPVDINQAPAEVLATLPGIGDVKAQAIVEDRNANGPYASLEDLTRVKGIGEGTVQDLDEKVTF